jgi:hypothetical protein
MLFKRLCAIEVGLDQPRVRQQVDRCFAVDVLPRELVRADLAISSPIRLIAAEYSG